MMGQTYGCWQSNMATQKKPYAALSVNPLKNNNQTNQFSYERGILMEKKNIEYQCTWCGVKQIRSVNQGRPSPGSCPRKPKTKTGASKPHTWVINRRF